MRAPLIANTSIRSVTRTVLLALSVVPLLASAQYHIPVYTGVPGLITGGMLNQLTLRQELNLDQASGPDRHKPRTENKLAVLGGGTGTTVLEFKPPSFPAKLAGSYPQPQRAQAQQLFTDLLNGFGRIEEQFGLPKRDLAAAVAAFVAGSWMAYRDTAFPDENFRPLVAQIREIVSRDPQFARASPAEKQETYEQLAILGMFMATNQMALQQRPNPTLQAKMKDAAKAYLEQFLKVDAERIQITSAGLVLR